VFEDRLRAEAPAALAALRQRGIELLIVSGDRRGVVAALAARLGIGYLAEQSPEAKLALVERLRAEGRQVVFCGDGVNDGPALAAADQGIAVAGATGAAQAAAGISLAAGGVEQLPKIFGLLAASRRLMRQNLAWALIWNLAALPLAIAGHVHPAVAAAAMSLSSLAVVLNTARLRR
jgi:P-type E1-E2 ATPase